MLARSRGLLRSSSKKGLLATRRVGLCAVRLWERKHELLGMNAAAKFEVVTAPRNEPTRHERIKAAILAVARGPNGDGAAAAPSDDPEQP